MMLNPISTTRQTPLVIQTRGLTKRFERHIAVNEVDLDIQAGEVYGLIGPNGAGKTTLIRMLATAEAPTHGEVYINGERLLPQQPNPAIKRRLGYLPDDFPVYDDLTVWDYLDYFARLYTLRHRPRQQRLFEVLELVQLVTKRKSKVATLSRGMKQRLSLARTIIHEPVLLLLDEPVSGLDPIARTQFREIIKTLQEAGMTILISSHVLSDLAELCTSIGVMELGCLVESTSLAELYRRRGRQKLCLTTLGDRPALLSLLQNHPLIADIQSDSTNLSQVTAYFSGTPADAAALLRSLIEADIPLTQFQPTSTDLETIFLQLGHQQAS
ncbi:MAG: ABC transporter ATP-binding protein [Cyanobacteria bacterium P01_G01_bin.54]